MAKHAINFTLTIIRKVAAAARVGQCGYVLKVPLRNVVLKRKLRALLALLAKGVFDSVVQFGAYLGDSEMVCLEQL